MLTVTSLQLTTETTGAIRRYFAGGEWIRWVLTGNTVLAVQFDGQGEEFQLSGGNFLRAPAPFKYITARRVAGPGSGTITVGSGPNPAPVQGNLLAAAAWGQDRYIVSPGDGKQVLEITGATALPVTITTAAVAPLGQFRIDIDRAGDPFARMYILNKSTEPVDTVFDWYTSTELTGRPGWVWQESGTPVLERIITQETN